MTWSDPEGAFEGWKECSRGRPCDYTGLTYAKLRGGSGIQWPCTDEAPDGTERLYADGAVLGRTRTTARSTAGTWSPGRRSTATEYKALNPDGKAMLKAAEYLPPARAARARSTRSS